MRSKKIGVVIFTFFNLILIDIKNTFALQNYKINFLIRPIFFFNDKKQSTYFRHNSQGW
jgi:hypothetical protein